ncbi:MAG: winged helix-turn-helix domain-containing protein [Thermodesulfobacteriota bacterium]
MKKDTREVQGGLNRCTVHSKIWIEDEEGHVVFGEGRYRILEAVDRLRSLQKAAVELKMSYRAVWGRIKASEERLGKALVAREGRGSRLTPYAAQLMSRYLELQKRIRQEADAAFDGFRAAQESRSSTED